MSKPPTRARYLLRFDDLCPTMDRAGWSRFVQLIRAFRIRPILAIVPDNQDPELVRDPVDAGFWDEMRALEASGATIGLHGYQHLCRASGSGLLPLHRKTEFAGAPEARQQQWIAQGLAILRGHGLTPRIWVAPRHGTDKTTLAVLRQHGLRIVSDGFARQPFQYCGAAWIPQQLWRPMEKQTGLWTICIHTNSASEDLVNQLHEFLVRTSAQFTSVDRALAEQPIRNRSLSDRWFQTRLLTRIRLSRWKRKLLPA